MGKVGEMNYKIIGERRDWLLCFWFIQLLVFREENFRKQFGTGFKIYFFYWWEALGLVEFCFGFFEVYFGVWGCEYLFSLLGKGESFFLEIQMSFFFYGFFQNIYVIVYFFWRGGLFYTGYILVADVCLFFDFFVIISFDGEIFVWNVEI